MSRIENEKGGPQSRPNPPIVFAEDAYSIAPSLLHLQVSRLARLYAVNAAMAEAIAPLVFLEALR
ncbi:hypothetical protein [Bradyrhizobium sp. 145]|uniref:hypothetical protein n=1 Tax=Bradyrhizobium sp. 145 TaxID=2782621 RepID=UPI001FFA1875|nr:hypothetical protein [Bradyrhizobium sp. 145]MCK1691618.1 hypothetical protein [Bradyrhizobium sp. 145]